MARITLQAAARKGQTPFANREATVERDGDNVFLSMPAEREGVISGSSATAFARAILAAAGVTSESAAASINAGIPAGWTLTPHDGGYVISDASGVVRGSFRPVTSYQSA